MLQIPTGENQRQKIPGMIVKRVPVAPEKFMDEDIEAPPVNKIAPHVGATIFVRQGEKLEPTHQPTLEPLLFETLRTIRLPELRFPFLRRERKNIEPLL